jgi:hypothetical protein
MKKIVASDIDGIKDFIRFVIKIKQKLIQYQWELFPHYDSLYDIDVHLLLLNKSSLLLCFLI